MDTAFSSLVFACRTCVYLHSLLALSRVHSVVAPIGTHPPGSSRLWNLPIRDKSSIKYANTLYRSKIIFYSNVLLIFYLLCLLGGSNETHAWNFSSLADRLLCFVLLLFSISTVSYRKHSCSASYTISSCSTNRSINRNIRVFSSYVYSMKVITARAMYKSRALLARLLNRDGVRVNLRLLLCTLIIGARQENSVIKVAIKVMITYCNQ